MQQLREPIIFKGASIEEIALQPTEKEPKAVLLVSADLDYETADVLECADMLFGENRTPRQFEGTVGLCHFFEGVTFSTEATGELVPDLLHKIRVSHESDITLKVSCRLHFTGAAYLQKLLEFFENTNKQPFDLTIRPRQGELFQIPEPEEPEEKSEALIDQEPLLVIEPEKRQRGRPRKATVA